MEPCDEVRREIIHQLSIRPMAHSELVKALPENVRDPSVLSVCRSCLPACLFICQLTCLSLQGNKETGLEPVIDSVASFRLVFFFFSSFSFLHVSPPEALTDCVCFCVCVSTGSQV